MSQTVRTSARQNKVASADGTEQVSHTLVAAEYFEGVLPHPAIIAQYEALSPGTFDWLKQRVELQQAHRMEIEKTAIVSRLSLARRGQVFAFILGLGCLAVAGFGFYEKQPLAGFGAVAVGIGTIATAFLVGLKRESDERAAKNAQLNAPLPPKPSTRKKK